MFSTDNSKCLRSGIVTLFLALSACTTSPVKLVEKHSLNVQDILFQVDEAIQSAMADPINMGLPPITSVNLDLQVSVGTEFDVQIPASAITISPGREKENVHRIKLTFVPSTGVQPIERTPASRSPLAIAVSNIYRLMSQETNNYKFRNGSVSIQCTVRHGAEVNVNNPRLVPFQIGAARDNQIIQTITLNFGLDPNKGSGRDENSHDPLKE